MLILFSAAAVQTTKGNNETVFLGPPPVRELYSTWLDALHSQEYCPGQFSQPIVGFRAQAGHSEQVFIPGRVANQQPSERRDGSRFTTQLPGPEKALFSVRRKMMV